MLGDSTVLGTGGGSSGDAVSIAAAAATVPPAAAINTASPDAAGIGGDGGNSGGGGGSSNSGDDEHGRGEEGERSFGGNRWPRQETLALLKIRSDMDVAFRDASVKGPLWEEVSRKLAELGYHRNAKKCKEKFENVYKYHKRTKEGRSGKSDGKTYRFFDQLEALENNPAAIHQSPRTAQTPLPATPVSIVKTTASLPQQQVVMMMSTNYNNTTPISTSTSTSTVPPPHATTTLPISMPQTQTTNNALNIPTITIPSSYPQPQQANPTYNFPPLPLPLPLPSATTNPSFPSIPTELLSNSSSSSTSSDETIEGRRKRKRKWKDFFERLMKEVVEKQEELQRRFLEAIEKREQERVAREESWRVQELQRINREREILAQERSIAAAKDQAVMSFLQKIAEQQNLGTTLNNINIIPQTTPTPTPPPIVQQQKQAQAQVTSTEPALVVPLAKQQTHDMQQQQQQQVTTNMEIVKVDSNNNNNGENMMAPSSSRWPKAEVQALINLRTSLDTKYQENGPKGPLWEEISSLMRKIGYNRNAKRCKEKWENINKYFKKVKESNKKRPEDSKTCPYFHQLDALYRERNKQEGAGGAVMKPNETMMAPLMVQPEQQWPPQQQLVQLSSANAGNDESLPAHGRQQHQHEEEEDGDDDEGRDMGEEDEDEDDDDDEGGDNYEIVASKPASVAASAE